MARYRWLISICITISFMQYFCDVQTETTQSQTTYEETTMEEQTSEVTTDAGLTETTGGKMTATDGLASTSNGVAMNTPAATLTTANVSLSTMSQIVLTSTLPTITEGEVTSMATKPLITPGVSIATNMVTDEAHTIPITAELSTTIVSMTKTDSPELTNATSTSRRTTQEEVTTNLFIPSTMEVITKAISTASPKLMTEETTTEVATSLLTLPENLTTYDLPMSTTAGLATKDVTQTLSTGRSTSELVTSKLASPGNGTTLSEGPPSTASDTATSVEELTVTTPRITTKASPPTSGRTTNEVVTSLYTSDNNVTLFTEPQMDTTEADFYPSSSLPPSPETVTERSELTITTSASVPTSRKSAACTRSSDCPQEKQVCVQRTNTCDCRPGLYYRDRDCIGIAFFVTHISLDVLFDEDLNDRTSNAFMNLQEEICEEITNIMLGNTSTLRAVFLGCYVNSFMNGSVIADIVTEYSTEITVVAADVTKMLGGLKSTGLNLTITWNITSEVFQLQHCSTGNNVCHENVSTCSDIKEMNGYECSCKDGFIDQDSVPGMYCIEEVDQGAVGGRYATVVGLALAVLFVVIILLSCIILLAKRIVKTKAEMTMDIPLSELPVHLTSKRRLTDFVPYPAGAKGTDEVDGYPTPDYPADGYADENGRKVKSRVMGDSVENVSYIPFEGGDDVNSTDSILYY
ncbi:uncharacterized protein [Apostichopus japonicus]|uniref:uncharacterized protein isoform X2 n=1 Tax=Stichopus japonicus TaxID=307972 RepID=UPI003AB506EB